MINSQYNTETKQRDHIEVYFDLTHVDFTTLIKKLEFVRDNEHTDQCFLNSFQDEMDIYSIFIRRIGSAKQAN
jgi:hypothetical protein